MDNQGFRRYPVGKQDFKQIREDVVMRTRDYIYVLELKIDGTATVDEALAQIDEKNYLIPYWNDPRPKVKVGVILDRDTRTIKDWKTVAD